MRALEHRGPSWHVRAGAGLEVPGELLELGRALFEEGVAALLCFVGAVGEAGGLAGEELLSEEARTMTQRELTRAMGRSAGAIREIVRGRTRITVDTALDLEPALGIEAELWLNLQSRHDLVEGRKRRGLRAG